MAWRHTLNTEEERQSENGKGGSVRPVSDTIMLFLQAAYKRVQICIFVTNITASVHRLWQLVTVFPKCLTHVCLWSRHLYNKLSLVWMDDTGFHVMAIKNIKLIHGQVAGPITAGVIASLCLRPWAVSLLGGECVARWPAQVVPKTDGWRSHTGPISW